MIKIKAKKSRLVFKAGSQFEKIASIPDQIQVNVEIQKDAINIGLNFQKETQPATPEVPEINDGDKITQEYQPAKKARFSVYESMHIVDRPDKSAYATYNLTDAHNYAAQMMQDSCEKGFEIECEITNL